MKKRPFAICHMMMSVDGRIDCAMTEQLGDEEAYYNSLASLQLPTTLMGRTTMEMHYTDGTHFVATDPTPIGKETFKINRESDDYTITLDSHGVLNITTAEVDKQPLLVVMSQDAPAEYAAKLDSLGISWIATGKGRVDLVRMAKILVENFGVERMAVVGGAEINGAMLAAGLIDEVSVIVGAGVDGRHSQKGLFDGISEEDWSVRHLRLQGVARVGEQAVWLRYDVLK